MSPCNVTRIFFWTCVMFFTEELEPVAQMFVWSLSPWPWKRSCFNPCQAWIHQAHIFIIDFMGKWRKMDGFWRRFSISPIENLNTINIHQPYPVDGPAKSESSADRRCSSHFFVGFQHVSTVRLTVQDFATIHSRYQIITIWCFPLCGRFGRLCSPCLAKHSWLEKAYLGWFSNFPLESGYAYWWKCERVQEHDINQRAFSIDLEEWCRNKKNQDVVVVHSGVTLLKFDIEPQPQRPNIRHILVTDLGFLRRCWTPICPISWIKRTAISLR